MNKSFFALLFLLIVSSSFSQTKETLEEKKMRQQALVDKYLINGAQTVDYNYQMAEWQSYLDAGLKIDSTVAYLWREKAMPYFKARKYEVGMTYVDKAVLYDRQANLPYRAFIKCIFSKNYKDAIADFELCKKEYGNSYVMDHTYNFYISLSYLQLNEYAKADALLKDYIDTMLNKNGEEWVNPTALFYYGIAKYELMQFDEAIILFNRALDIYQNFSDAKYYKAICMARLQQNPDEISTLIKESRNDYKLGYTIPESNVVYETYPYQKKWRD